MLVNAVQKIEPLVANRGNMALAHASNTEPMAPSLDEAGAAPNAMNMLLDIFDKARVESARQSNTGRNTPRPGKR